MHRRIRSIFDHTPFGISYVDKEHRFLAANDFLYKLIGLPSTQVLGEKCYNVLGEHKNDANKQGTARICSYCLLDEAIRTGKKQVFERPFGDRWLRVTTVPEFDASGKVRHFLEIFEDITSEKAREAEIHQAAFYDALTGLANRRRLHERLGYALSASARSGRHGALFYLDLDHFKTLNDSRGHATGDRLLVMVGDRLRAMVRENDMVTRLGGDEFTVLLEGLSREEGEAALQAGHLAEKIRALLAQPYDLGDLKYHATASIGITLFRGHELPVEELLRRADIAMYQAKKQNGGDTVSFIDQAAQAAMEASLVLEVELRRALQKNQLRLYYQPQLDHERRIIGAEALLRWHHPERGVVPPAAFIPLAEKSCLILEISRWVLMAACTELKRWDAIPAARKLRLAVNVSARQFRQPDFVEEVRRIISRTGANPMRLKLELTESMIITNPADATVKMNELRRQGVGCSLDDFGTGYSSLAQLQRLPFDQLKIDRAFVNEIDRGDGTLAELIIRMGRQFDLQVVAEGVESEAQFTFLQNYGCHAYQGYLFSKPLPATEFEQLLLTGFIDDQKKKTTRYRDLRRLYPVLEKQGGLASIG